MYLHIVYHTLCYSFSKEIFKTCAEWRFLKKIGRSLKTLDFLGCKTFIFLYTSYYIQENKYEFEREYAQTNWQFRHTHYLWNFSTKVIYWSKIIFNLFHQSIYHPQKTWSWVSFKSTWKLFPRCFLKLVRWLSTVVNIEIEDEITVLDFPILFPTAK